MSRATKIKYVAIHCQGAHNDLQSMQAYWKKTLGWKSPGYHFWIDYDGTVHQLAPLESITNGVQGFNTSSVHICYRGGVNLLNNKIVEDTRNIAQKTAIQETIFKVITWLKENGKDVSKDLMILGHRDFSTDVNQNGKIDSFERIKGCPSFDAIPEYAYIIESVGGNPKQLLPKNRK